VAIICERFADGEQLFYDVLGQEVICERSAEADIELRDDWAGPQQRRL
jgi:hypothetical protein